MIPMVLGLASASMISGRITSNTGRYKIFMIVGTGLAATSYLYLANITADWEIWQVSVGMVLLGLGVGQLLQTLTIASQNAVEAKDIGVATSSSTFFRQMGGTLGVAIFLSILFSGITERASQIVSGVTNALAKNPSLMQDPRNEALLGADLDSIAEMVTTDSSFLEVISPELSFPIREAFAQSSSQVFLVATIVLVAGFILSFFVKEIELRTKSGIQEMAEGS
jgi:hypothetical protein